MKTIREGMRRVFKNGRTYIERAIDTGAKKVIFESTELEEEDSWERTVEVLGGTPLPRREIRERVESDRPESGGDGASNRSDG